MAFVWKFPVYSVHGCVQADEGTVACHRQVLVPSIWSWQTTVDSKGRVEAHIPSR